MSRRETYRTLQNNIEKSGFDRKEPSFRWARDVEGVAVVVEFLCETDNVEPGRIFRPKGEFTGSKLGPNAYAAFLATPEDEEGMARLRREAVATVREFLAGFAYKSD